MLALRACLRTSALRLRRPCPLNHLAGRPRAWRGAVAKRPFATMAMHDAQEVKGNAIAIGPFQVEGISVGGQVRTLCWSVRVVVRAIRAANDPKSVHACWVAFGE